jgi:general nucleoside transport system ATP-binding protein
MGAVTVEGVSKRFGVLRALTEVSAEFRQGEIHAVLGENGAGKSTLMNVLAGFVTPDEGKVTLDGNPIPLGQPHAIRYLGISMVHQHFMLVPEFTVAENLALAQIDSLVGLSRVDSRAEHALEIARNVGWEINPKARVRDLPVGVQQRVEILKALADDAQVLIFDEPTAVLSAEEVADLFRVLARLRDEGKTIILIAHKLAEVLVIADRVTVLRHGVKVASVPIDQADARKIVEWMVGPNSPSPLEGGARRAAASEAESTAFGESPTPDSRPAIKAHNLTVLGDRGETAAENITFEIHSGEILGFGGVDGNGQVELAEALAGIRNYKGELEKPVAVYVPQDRQTDGLALYMSIRDNLLIAGHQRPEFLKGPFLRNRALRDWAQQIKNQFNIKADDLSDPVSSLSGGNQQKVVVGRSLDQTPALLVVVNPTRGLDFNATAFVQDQIRKAAREGASVALFSTDRDELDALADRQLFMSKGRLHDSLESALVGT